MGKDIITAAVGGIADARGKLFEIEVAHQLTDQPIVHFRQISLEQERCRLRAALPSYICATLIDDAELTARAVGRFLAHQLPLQRLTVAWTSNPLDCERLIGIAGAVSPADLIIRAENQFVGLSLKYGTKPSARSPGIGRLRALLPSARLDGYLTEGQRLLDSWVLTHGNLNNNNQVHEAIKAELRRNSTNAIFLVDSFRILHRSIASAAVESFNQLSHYQQISFVAEMIGGKHDHFDLLYVHQRPGATVKIYNPVERFQSIVSEASEWFAQHNGAKMHVYARIPSGLIKMLVLTIKNKGSTPAHGVVGQVCKGSGRVQ